jgi:hypothetical protein
MKLKLTLCLLLLSFAAFSQSKKKILFIGNSYTYVNNLPQILYDLAMMTNDTIIFDSSVPGGSTFQTHCTDTSCLRKIKSQQWDYVVLQEQSQTPSFPPSQVQTDCYPYAKRLDSLIKANDSCTQTIFYMTWGRKYGDAANCSIYPPLCTYAGMQQRLRESYLEMADSNKTFVAPAGAAWRNCRIADSAINLYQTDYSHPSIEGSYLTACVFYASIYKKSPMGNFFMSSLGTATAYFLQTIAKQTVLDSLSNWNIGKYALPKSCGAVDTSHHTTGINENLKNEISIYPNPCGEKLFVNGCSLLGNTIEVVDVLGRVCSIPPFQRGQGGLELNISTLPCGIYFIKASDIKGNVLNGEFVKE